MVGREAAGASATGHRVAPWRVELAQRRQCGRIEATLDLHQQATYERGCEGAGERGEWRSFGHVAYVAEQGDCAPPAGAAQHLAEQPGLADPGLALDGDDRAVAGARRFDGSQRLAPFGRPADERRALVDVGRGVALVEHLRHDLRCRRHRGDAELSDEQLVQLLEMGGRLAKAAEPTEQAEVGLVGGLCEGAWRRSIGVRP